MNKKDYLEIAMIIKEGCFTAMSKEIGLCWSDTPKTIINKLADYFEREDDGKCVYCKQILTSDKCSDCNIPDNDKFNRKQFLKDCGVE